MNKPIFIAAAALLLGWISAAEPQTVRLDFASEPEMTETTFPGGQKYIIREKSAAIPVIQDRDFTFEAKVNIRKIGHYGSVLIGLSNSKRAAQDVFFRFSRTSFKNHVCFYSGTGLKSKPDTAPPFIGFRKGICLLRIDYSAATVQARWRLSDGAGQLLHDTGWIRTHAPVNPDRITIRATDKAGLDKTEIRFDPQRKCLFIRSLIGYEGKVPYVLEMEILNITLRAGRGEK